MSVFLRHPVLQGDLLHAGVVLPPHEDCEEDAGDEDQADDEADVGHQELLECGSCCLHSACQRWCEPQFLLDEFVC